MSDKPITVKHLAPILNRDKSSIIAYWYFPPGKSIPLTLEPGNRSYTWSVLMGTGLIHDFYGNELLSTDDLITDYAVTCLVDTDPIQLWYWSDGFAFPNTPALRPHMLLRTEAYPFLMEQALKTIQEDRLAANLLMDNMRMQTGDLQLYIESRVREAAERFR